MTEAFVLGREEAATSRVGDRTWLTLAPLAIPVGLLVAHAPTTFLLGDFTPRLAIVVGAGVVGLLTLGRLTAGRDRAAAIGALLVLWILVTAVFSGAPMLALKGTMGRELTGLIVILSLGLWALGRVTPGGVVERLPLALFVGLSLNAAVGVAQVLFQIEAGWLSMQSGRATGLTPNPVYGGALMAAGAALTAASRAWRLGARVAGVAMFAVAADFSGSRVAVVAGLAATTIAAFVERERLRGFWAAALPTAFVGGFVASTILGSVLPSSRTSAERLAGADSGGRLTAWRYGVEAFAERPLFGYGFGRFRAATQERFSPDFVRAAASDDVRQAWFDPHNAVISVLVAIGLIGLLLAAWFVVEASRHLDSRLSLMALAIALTWLMQPVALATFPLVMFVLGCAATRGPRAESFRGDGSSRWSRSGQLAVLAGSLAAGWLLIGDLRMQAALDRGDPVALAGAAAAFPHDPVIADLVAQAHLVDPSLAPDVLHWSQRAVDYEPDRPYFWRRHGARLFLLGRPEEAIAALERAIELQPWHLQSWQGLYIVGEAIGDDEVTATAHVKLCVLDANIAEEPC